MKTATMVQGAPQEAARLPAVGRADDAAEREAQAIAARVTRDASSEPVRPIPVSAPVPRRADASPLPVARTAKLARGIRATGPGRPLPAGLRDHFEHRLGHDLAAVRLHDDAHAAALARSAGARAFAQGNAIYFGAGRFRPETAQGSQLLAHELVHTLQQRGLDPATAPIQREGEEEEEAPPPPAPPTRIDFNFNPTNAIPAGAGGTATLRATTDATVGITWSIEDGTAAKAAGTSIAADGTITFDAAQAGGSLSVKAENAGGSFARPFSVAAVPTGIDATSVLSALNSAATDYGAAFQHTFTSAAGSTTVLENLRIGEKFPNAPSPNAASHTFTGAAWPFGRGSDSFTLSTGTLANDATGAWALDASGEFGPPAAGSTLAQGDNVSTAKSLINIGDHVASHSNPTPRNRLPVTMTLDQEFHFFNPRAASGSRWTRFTTTAHSRTLRLAGDEAKFVTTVNGIENEEDYEGRPAVFGLTAAPVNTPKSASAPVGGGAAPAPRTVTLTARTLPATLPAGASLAWSVIAPDLGCTVTPDTADPTQARLTVGSTAGTVTVQIAENTGTNTDRVQIRITG